MQNLRYIHVPYGWKGIFKLLKSFRAPNWIDVRNIFEQLYEKSPDKNSNVQVAQIFYVEVACAKTVSYGSFFICQCKINSD